VVAVATVGVLVVAAVIASVIGVPYYAITPGSGIPVSSLISVPKKVAHSHLGDLFLTDVDVVSLDALSYLYYRFDSNDQVVSSSALVGSATSSQYNEQGVVDMYDAREAATVVALRQLGYKTRAVASGVTVYQPEAGALAAKGLRVGDVIVGIDGKSVRLITGLVSAIGRYRPGASVTLSLDHILSSTHRTVKVTLGEVRIQGTGSAAEEVCADPGTDSHLQPLLVHNKTTACLAIDATQDYATVDLPFPVSISADGIVGPSAGLAFTLGLIEKLDTQDLAAGLKIAATGTMSVTGLVGDVGGVAQKTIAVREAGAAVFFVPPQEYKTALAHAGPTLKIIEVSSITQAIQDLEGLGGRLTPTSSSS
jgi:PDZ domain-containing protein